MRIHSNTLTERDLFDAREAALAAHPEDGQWIFDKWNQHSSRKRDHAFEVTLIGDGTKSKHRRNPGSNTNQNARDEYAATWDQWGWFLAELFRRDPNMTSQYYSDVNDFHAKTKFKFDTEEA